MRHHNLPDVVPVAKLEDEYLKDVPEKGMKCLLIEKIVMNILLSVLCMNHMFLAKSFQFLSDDQPVLKAEVKELTKRLLVLYCILFVDQYRQK